MNAQRQEVVPANFSFTPVSSGLLQRQCACGNHIVAGGKCTECAKNKSGLQRRIAIGASHDALEREADRMADQVLAAPAHATVSGAPQRIQHFARQSTGQMDAVPASVDQALASPGRPLEPTLRQDMEQRLGYDFSQVRVHSGAAAEQSARDVNAKAYTVGHDMVFGAGRFVPETHQGQRLLAHELTHVMQQTMAGNSSSATTGGRGVKALGGHPAPGVVQRSLTEAQLTSTPDTTIRQDPDYLDNRITRIEFYTAELAIIYYEDGAQFRLGLVPGQIQPPVVGVDYRTRRSEHLLLNAPGPGQTRFLPRARQIRAPGMTAEQVTQEFGRTIVYHVDTVSHRIVPTEVNDITAPRLCEVLRRAEAEYVRATDELARGMVRALEILEIALIIASFIPTAGESASAAAARGAGAAGAAEAGVLGRAVSVLRPFFLRLLRSGATEAITVEGVGFGGVRVLMSEGRVMTVLRNTIVNVERIPGQGRLIHSAFEQAAVAAAREAGATSVRVGLQTVVNAQWAAYLESIGYAVEVIPNAGGFSRVLMRTLPL